jgi:transcriptional regulator with XRE-family HTH domain
MLSSNLRLILGELGLAQTELARLIGVTPRAVSLWLKGDREIPGPVEAYLNLLAKLPIGIRQTELARIAGRSTPMREGMYGIEFNFQDRIGHGTLVFEGGRIYGADVGAARYDGDYAFNEGSGMVDVNLKVTFPPNGMSVFGIAHPYEWAIEVRTVIDPSKDAAPIKVTTNLGRGVDAQYHFLRDLPDAA